MKNHGTFSYPGVGERLYSASYTLAQGVSPGVISVDVPAGTMLQQEGTATFSRDGVTITIPGCRVDSASSRISGGSVWSWSILDWRWKWAFGSISGVYNQRDGSGKLKKNTERTPRELAAMLLDEMRVTRRDLSALPENHRPEVEWVFANPAKALSDLADEVGCRVVPRLDGSVAICRTGEGRELPDGPQTAIDIGVDVGEKPSAVVVVGAPGLYQGRWELEAVGRESDGRWVPVDELSYKPAAGWSAQVPGFLSDVQATTGKVDKRVLALQSVYKAYRIKKFIGSGNLPGIDISASDLKRERVLPTLTTLAETWENPETKETSRSPAKVVGTWTDNEAGGGEKTDAVYPGRFTIEADAGVVVFDEPIFKKTFNQFAFPELYCELGFPVAKSETSGQYRPTWKWGIDPASNAGDAILRADDIQFTARMTYGSGNSPLEWKDNRDEEKLDEYGKDLARRYAASLETHKAGQRQYVGFVQCDLDGAISQITWSCGTGSATKISRNAEHDSDIIPPFKRRREMEKAAAEAAKGKKK